MFKTTIYTHGRKNVLNLIIDVINLKTGKCRTYMFPDKEVPFEDIKEKEEELKRLLGGVGADA